MEYSHFINGAAINEDLRAGRPTEVKIIEVASEVQYVGMSRKGLSITKIKLILKSILLFIMRSGKSSNMNGSMFNVTKLP